MQLWEVISTQAAGKWRKKQVFLRPQRRLQSLEAVNNKYGDRGARARAREGCIGGEMSEQYVSVVTLLKVTEMPGHPARRGESNHAVSVRAPGVA